MNKAKIIVTLVMLSSFSLLTNCASYSNRTAASGALFGAIAGKSTGNHSDSRAAKGAILGGLAGHAYGHEVEAGRYQQNYNYRGYGRRY